MTASRGWNWRGKNDSLENILYHLELDKMTEPGPEVLE
jgi:hypothetical protein